MEGVNESSDERSVGLLSEELFFSDVDSYEKDSFCVDDGEMEAGESGASGRAKIIAPPSPAAPAKAEDPEVSVEAKGKQIRRVCFTCNNYEEGPEGPILWEIVRKEKRIASFTCGKEIGANGTPHLQGYFETASKRGHSIRAMQKWPLFRKCKVAMLQARGTAKQNRVYTQKDGDFIEYGPS